MPSVRARVLSACLVLTCLVFASCSPAGPRDVAEHYLTALSELDFGAAAGDVAGEGRATLEQLQRVHATLTPEEQEKFRVKDWTILSHQQMGDRATVEFLYDKTKPGQLTLKNYAGTWKVVARTSF